MARSKSLVYAEDELGVHKIWNDTCSLAAQISDLYALRASLDSRIRSINTMIERRKGDLLVKEASANPKMSAAAMERHMRLVYAQDEELHSLVNEYNDVSAHRDVVDAQIKSAETNHKGHIARLNELGGYFEYLASVKLSQLQLSHLPY